MQAAKYRVTACLSVCQVEVRKVGKASILEVRPTTQALIWHRHFHLRYVR